MIFNNSGAGINSTSTNNSHFNEGCHVYSNDSGGITLMANGNTGVRNQVVANSVHQINQSGGGIAPVQAASTAVGTMHPHANFQ